jgi:hypothetical protein
MIINLTVQGDKEMTEGQKDLNMILSGKLKVESTKV